MTTRDIREVVRSELLHLAARLKPKGKKGVWQFLNSGFALWALSSIFIGSITFAYSVVSEKSRTERERAERFARLDSELELRFQPVVKRIGDIRSNPFRQSEEEKIAASKDSSTSETVTVGDSLTPEETKLLFHKPAENEQYQREFAEYTVKSLFAEGYFLSRDPKEKASINAALAALESARMYEQQIALLENGKLLGVRYSITVEGDDADARKKLIERGMKGALRTARNLLEEKGQELFEADIIKSWDLWRNRKSWTGTESPSGSPVPSATITRQQAFRAFRDSVFPAVKGTQGHQPTAEEQKKIHEKVKDAISH